MEEKVKASLDNARKLIKTADHMIYMTYPMVRENRLLIKILEEIHESLVSLVRAVLHFEYINKRITLYRDTKANFEIFAMECANNYGISREEVNKIRDIFNIIEKHKQSPVEFLRKDKFVIMSDNLGTETITFDVLKSYLRIAKNVLRKTESSLDNWKNVYKV